MSAQQGLPKDTEGDFDLPALDVSYDDAMLPHLGVDNVQAAIDELKTGFGNVTVFKDTQFAVVDAVDATKQWLFDIAGSTNTKTTLRTAPTVNRLLTTPDRDGDVLVCDVATRQVFINQSAPDNASGAGIQYRSDVSSRPQLRVTQYGNNAGVPGLSSFKSRGIIPGPDLPGTLVPVVVGDVIGRLTCVGVTDNLSIPLSGLASFNVTAVPVASGWIGTEFEIQTVSKLGPANGRRRSFAIDSEGVMYLRENRYPASPGNSCVGVANTGALGTVVVANTNVTANTRIALTIQEGNVPKNGLYVSARVPGVSFTIQMIDPTDVGVNVYYQLCEPMF